MVIFRFSVGGIPLKLWNIKEKLYKQMLYKQKLH